MNSLLILSFILFSLAVIILYFSLIKALKTKKQQVQELQKMQQKLQAYIAKSDHLISSLGKIHDLSQKTTGFTIKEELANFIIEASSKFFNSGTCSVMLINPDNNNLEIISSKNLPEEFSKKSFKVGEGISSKVAKTGKGIFVDDIAKDPRFLKVNYGHYKSNSFISIPIKTKNKVIGVLNMTPGEVETPFEDKNLHLLNIMADQFAISFENISLYSNLQQLCLSTIESLAKIADAKDSYTYDHADRARKYACMISKKFNLVENITKYIEYAALMHDIGKIAIDNSILEKPGALTKEERAHIEQHPTVGSKILQQISFLAPVIPMIQYHHVWYNGEGYPKGLKGEQIPLGARIVAVIDAFDAMTSNRPYRKALSIEIAIAELKKLREIQFDPDVVDIFVDTLFMEKSIYGNN